MTLDPRSNTIDGLVRRSAARFPTRVALRFADRQWTYRELDDAVSNLAVQLHSLGLSAGDRIAAYGTNSDAYVLMMLAASRAGVIHVPVNYALRGDELRYVLADCGAKVVVADPALIGNIEVIRGDLAVESVVPFRDADGSVLERARVARPAADPYAVHVAETDIAQVQYTSGTTSSPKGAVMTHSGLVLHYMSCVIVLSITAEDNPMICMPLYHSAATHAQLMPYLSLGATIRIMSSADPDVFMPVIAAERIGTVFLAPTVWVKIADHPHADDHDLSSLHHALYGASVMPVPVLQRLRAKYPNMGFYNGFGQTEVGPLVSVLTPSDHDERPASCGRAVPFVEIRVVDDDGVDVGPDVPGEVIYRSPQLCLEYWNNAEATAEAFRDGWFYSGDLATRDGEGYLTIVDRIKDVINTGGVLVASREVEDALHEHPAVADVAVIATPHPTWIEAITAVVVLHDGDHTTDEAALIEHVKSRLAPFKAPKRVLFVADLPRNESGKTLKRELREMVARLDEAEPLVATAAR